MKTLKFKTEIIKSIVSGNTTKTWRLFDDKQLELDDIIQFINSDTGRIFGYAKIKSIEVKHLKNINPQDMQGYNIYNNIEEILVEFKKFYGPNVGEDSIVKIIGFEYLGDKVPSNEDKNTTKITEVRIYTDGGSRGNPGPSAGGFAIVDMDDNIIKNGGMYLGITTNNQAEYQAVRLALKNAEEMGIRVVHFCLDSLLVVNQMNGVFKIRNRELWPIHQEIVNQIKHFKKVTFTHIPREMNKIADGQVNEILDNQQKNGLESELL